MANDEVTRRGVLAGLGKLAVVGAVGEVAGCAPETASNEELGEIQSAVVAVPLREVPLSGVHAYAEKSVTAGQDIQLRISAPNSTQIGVSLVRLGWDAESSSRDWEIDMGTVTASRQAIKPGSYVHVSNPILWTVDYPALTLECWVRPWRLDKWQGLITQYNYSASCGFGLFLDASGRPVVYFGTGGAFEARFLSSPASTPLTLNPWNHVVAVFSAGVVTIYVNNVKVYGPFTPTSLTTTRAANVPLRIGAYGDAGFTDHTLDGDIAMPVIYSKALSTSEINTRWLNKGDTVPTGSVLACWPLTEESSSIQLIDASGNAHNGTVYNNGTWMVGGPRFNAERLKPDGSERFPKASYRPDTDATRGHGLRLCSDDLLSCQWNPTGSPIHIPTDMPPGVYSARLRYTLAGAAKVYDTVFVVRRPSSKPVARVLVLCNSNTWLAYNTPFPADPEAKSSNTGYGNPDPLAGTPAASMYANHSNARPGYKVGTDMPWSPFPYMYYDDPNVNLPPYYGHLLKAERHLHNWLEQNGYDYDVASDYDLHVNASLLTGYKVVVINGHSEYWSAQGYNAIKSYLAGGGNVFVASGNTMFWRVSFSSSGDVMECRKLESESATPGDMGGRPNAQVGELYHSHDKSRGGLLRESGFPTFGAGLPAWKVIGVDSVGYSGSTLSEFKIAKSDHVFFNQPEALGLANNDTFAAGAVRHEWDVTRAAIQGAPADSGAAPVQLAKASVPAGATYVDYRCQKITPPTGALISEIIDWQRPAGGRVVAAGAIGVGRMLSTDSKLGAFTRNVLHQFGLKQRLDLFVVASSGRLRSRRWDGSSWAPSAGWDDVLGGNFASAPQVVQWSPNTTAIVGVSATGSLLYRNWNGNGNAWDPVDSFREFPGTLTGRPAVVGFGRNRVNIYARGTDGVIAAKWWDGGAWSTGWTSLGGPAMLSDPAAVAFQGRKIALAAIGPSNHVYVKLWDGVSWAPVSGWTDMGGDFSYAPALVAWGGTKLNLFAVNRGDGHLWTKHFDGKNWDPNWYDLGGSLASRPVAVARRAKEFSVFAVGIDGKMKVKWFDGTNWGPDASTLTDLGGSFAGDPAATAWRGNHVSVMGISSSGVISYKWTAGSSWFPSDTTWDTITGGLAFIKTTPAIVSFVGS